MIYRIGNTLGIVAVTFGIPVLAIYAALWLVGLL